MPKTNEMDSEGDVASYELFAEDGVKLTSLTLGATVFIPTMLTQVAHQVLKFYEVFLDKYPPDKLKFYSTENMRRHKPVTKAALNMLPTWLKDGAPEREYIRLQLKNGSVYQDAPQLKFEVFGIEPKAKAFKLGYSNLVSIGLPPTESQHTANTIRDIFIDLCKELPFSSGHAGWVMECSSYEEERAQTHAWSMSMRHPGVDIFRATDDSIAVGQDAVKGVGWLSAIDSKFVALLGGARKLRKVLPREVEIIELPSGLIFQAGSVPMRGDVNRGDNLPLYRAVFRQLSPLIAPAKERSPSLNLASDYVERTETWFARLGNG